MALAAKVYLQVQNNVLTTVFTLESFGSPFLFSLKKSIYFPPYFSTTNTISHQTNSLFFHKSLGSDLAFAK